ncbi:MAG: ROK family protein [Candidatus Cryptobacteroides sp.]
MDKRLLLGVDIGGTKCAVSLGLSKGDDIEIKDKEEFPTLKVYETIAAVETAIRKVLKRNSLIDKDISAIGVSCGGPLDSSTGIIMSPPNLPGWDNIPIVALLSEKFDAPVAVHNDANACALAEWKFGAGKGAKNMVFLTFGTGLGAGLILDGKLYTGTNDNAGELGHIRLNDFGPVGYGKSGSFEGFCSGGGIKQLAQSLVKERMQMGMKVSWCPDGNLDRISAKSVAEAANAGDPLASEIYRVSARQLGFGLSIVVDILNPELIVVGSIYSRNESLMRPFVEEVLEREALPLANKVCRIVPAALGDAIGDYAALSVAANILM